MANPCKEAGCARCCQDIDITLTVQEYQRLISLGATLTSNITLDLVGRTNNSYHMSGRCPNLNDNDECAVHSMSEQMQACKLYVFNGVKCVNLRKK